ncbi:MAG: hypothetical protein M3485_09450, partial [Pseudomonadota bacterium]|nr:hypothetical protein [Pseudomonadota bacterium]
ASLALAVGVAWQLRPLPDAGIEYSEAPAATARPVPPDITAPAADNADDELADGMWRQGAPTAATQSPETLPEEVSRTREAAARREAAAVEVVPQPPAAAEPAVAGTPGATSPVAFPPAPAPPPAPAAPPPSQPDRSVLRSVDSQAPQPQRDATQAQKSAAARADAAAAETGPYSRNEDLTGVHDEPYDEQPPASADSPEVRRAWLARIRELVAEGRLEPARASLREFRRRYPQAPIPDDLQPLID